jgi:hypothetical protein
MEEQELLDLLYEAYQKGASQQDLDKIKTWYAGQKTDSVGHQFKQPATGGLPDGLAVREVKPKEKNFANNIPVVGPMAVQAYSGFVDRIPEAVSNARAMQWKDQNFEDEIANRYQKETREFLTEMAKKSGGLYTDEETKQQFGQNAVEASPFSSQEDIPAIKDISSRSDVFKRAASAYYKRLVGEAQFNKEKADFDKKRSDLTIADMNRADEQAKEAEAKTGGLITSYKDIKGPIDAANYVGGAIGEALPTSVTGALGGSFGMEGADAYRESLDLISKKLSETTGVEVTPQQVVELGFDKPAREYAGLVGGINGTIESLGTLLGPLGKVFTRAFATKGATEIVSKGLARHFLEGAGSEALTEFTQESITQYMALKSTGLSDEEALEKIDWSRSAEAAVKGGLAGGVFSALGGGTKPKGEVGKVSSQEEAVAKTKEKAQTKVAEQIAEIEANTKLADDIIEDETLNESVDLSDIGRLSEDIKNIQKEKIIAEESKDLVKEEEKLTETKDKLAEKSLKEAIKDEAVETKKAKGASKKATKPEIETPASTNPDTSTQELEEATKANKEIKAAEAIEKAKKPVELEVTNPEKIAVVTPSNFGTTEVEVGNTPKDLPPTDVKTKEELELESIKEAFKRVQNATTKEELTAAALDWINIDPYDSNSTTFDVRGNLLTPGLFEKGKQGFIKQMQYIADARVKRIKERIANTATTVPKPAVSTASSVSNAVEEIYSGNKDLQATGTSEEYQTYLKTIFPKSSVPIVVYHGSPKEFDVFDKQFLGTNATLTDLSHKGFFFTDDKRVASYYGKSKPYLINIENPAQVQDSYNNIIGSALGDINNALKANPSADGVILKGFRDSVVNDEIAQRTGEYTASQTQYIVFEPNQIHSVGSSADIAKFKDWKSSSKKQFKENPEKIVEEQKITKGPQQSEVKAEEKVEPKRRGRRRKPDTIKEEGTKINLETGDVTEIKPRRGRTEKKQEGKSGSDTGVQGELPTVEPVKKSPNPQAKNIEDEKVKLRNRFESIKKLPRKQLVEERLTKLIEKDIPDSIDPSSHQEVLDEATKELAKVKEARTAKTEQVTKNKEKARPKKEVSKEEVKAKEDTAKELEALEEEKKTIVNKYGEIRSKTGQVLRRATPQVDDKGSQLWEQVDLDRIREINDKISELRSGKKKRTPEQDVKAQALKDQGLDDDVIDTIISPDDFAERSEDLKKYPFKNRKLDDTRKEIPVNEIFPNKVDSEYMKKISEITPGFREEEVSISDIIPTQKTIKSDYISSGMDYLPKAIKHNGKYYLHDGHHRVAHQILDGAKKIKIIVRDSKGGKKFRWFLTADNLDIQNVDIEERVQRDYTNFEEIKIDDYVEQLSNVNSIFNDIVAAQFAIIKQALSKNKNFRIFKASTKASLLGEAIRDGKNFIIILNKNVPISDYTKQHEFNHIFEFAINSLESSDPVFSKSWRKINDIFDSLKNKLENMTKEEKKIFDALYPSDSNIYGLKNAREMVAESMVNPKFAALLASLKTTSNGKKVSILEKLYNALVNFVNDVIDTYKFKIPKIKSLDSTYLGNIIDVFESTLKDVGDLDFSSKEINQIAKTAFGGEETFLEAETKDNRTAKMADRIMSTVHAKGIDDIKVFRTFLKEVESSLGQKLDRGLKASLTRRFNTYIHYKYMVTHKDEVMRDLYKSGKNIEPAYKSIVDDVRDISIDTSTVASINKWGKILQELNIGTNEMFAKHKTAVQKEAARQQTEKIVKAAPKSGFRKITSLINNKMNLQTFLGAISKQMPQTKTLLYNTFAKPLLEAHRSATLEANKIMQEELLPVIRENKLQTSNLQRIHFFAVLQRFNSRIGETIEERIAKEREYLQNKLLAARKYDGRLKPDDVLKELQVLEEVGDKLLAGEEVLSDGEKAYFDKQQFILNSLKDVVKSTKEIVWGKEFREDAGIYTPTSALGSIPVGGQSFQDLRSSDSQELIDVLENRIFIDENIYASQSGHSVAKTGGRGTYYDNNAHTVMSKYLHSILFDSYGSYDIQKLNKMFHGYNRNQLDEAIGIDNMNVIFDAEKRAIRRALRPSIDYSKLGKMFVKAQQFLQTAKIGTLGQFFTQYIGMVPATAAITSVPATYKALEFQIEMARNPELRTKFKEALETTSADLAIRDFWWEKYESAEDRAKDDLRSKVQRIQETIDKNTVTKVMSISDKGAAQLTWIASMIEQGADIKNPDTWTQEQVTNSDLKTTQLQNSSSTLFLPKVLERDSESAMLLASILYSFKSFQLNAMMNLIANVPDAFSQPSARKTIAALAVSALGYEMAALGVMKVYTTVGLTIAAALGYEPPEEKKNKKAPSTTTKVLTNSFYNLLFGGLSNVTDSVWRYAINQGVIPFLVGDYDHKGKLKFDQTTQSPLYGPTDLKQTFYKMFGVFSGLAQDMIEYSDMQFDRVKGTDISGEREEKNFDNLIGDVVSMAPLLPFRGDISKLWNVTNREISRRRKARKRKPKKRKWNS